jgi:glutamate formiminotransferase/formiminotetrahydrofolate cyclodeaminase
VGALCARSAVIGAFLNVKVNASGLKDKGYVEDILGKGTEMVAKAKVTEEEILKLVYNKIEGV